MALTGLHVVARYAGGSGPGGQGTIALRRAPTGSQTLASAGVSTVVAPAESIADGRPCFTLRSSVDAWVAVGPTPVATQDPRFLLPAGTDEDLIVNTGDKIAWTAA